MAALTTLANVKAWMGINGTGDDAVIARLIDSASESIQEWLSRNVSSVVSYAEVRDGNGKDYMLVAETPLITVTGVVIDGQQIQPASEEYSIGYFSAGDVVYLRGYTFTAGRANVRINYSAGFSSVPSCIEQACIEIVSLRYKERDRIGLQSKGIAGESTSYMTKDMPDSAKTLLNNYRKVVQL